MPHSDTSATGVMVAAARESWPVRGLFTIARGARTVAEVVVATVTAADGTAGRGECVPYARYDETPDSVIAQIQGAAGALRDGAGRGALQTLLPPGAARNALDCALWDWAAKASGAPVWQLAGLNAPAPCVTAYTLSLNAPAAMGEQARQAADRPLLKLKLGGGDDAARVRAVRAGAPDARLIVDANESWSPEETPALLRAMADLGVEMVEQPLPAGKDGLLADIPRPVPVCADESAHACAGLPELAGRYDMVNIKLDKTGGLTEALAVRQMARELSLKVMVGCMLGTSLSMAPAMLVAQGADVVDLDAPLLLARDRDPGLEIDGSLAHPSAPALWG